MLCHVQLDQHFQMCVVNLDTKSLLRYLNENTLLPEDYTVKSHKLQKRAADNKHLFHRKAILCTYLKIYIGILGRWIGEYQVQFVFSV